MSSSSYSTRQAEIQNSPEKLFDQINVCHNHSAAAIAFASELVHGIAWKLGVSENARSLYNRKNTVLTHRESRHQVVVGSAPIDLRQPTTTTHQYQQVTSSLMLTYLAARKTTNWYNHHDILIMAVVWKVVEKSISFLTDVQQKLGDSSYSNC